MKRTTYVLAVVIAPLCFVGCSSAQQDRPGPSPAVAGISEAGGAPTDSASSGTGNDDARPDAAPLTADGGADDATGDAPQAADGSTQGATNKMADSAADANDGSNAADVAVYTGPPRPAPLCSPAAVWNAGTRLDVSTPVDDAFPVITPDELSIAWTAGNGPAAMIYYADRSASTDPFGPPQTLSASGFAADRVALSPDGLRLVVVNLDRQGFSELSRVAPNTPFGPAVAGAYVDIDVPGGLAAGESFGDPVLSQDDVHFFYSVYGAGRANTVFSTTRIFLTDNWSMGFPVAAAADLVAQGILRRRPTGLALDQQTLFFWDEVSGVERAAWMNDATGVFDVFVTLGARTGASPDATCRKLYYSAPGPASVDLFVASN